MNNSPDKPDADGPGQAIRVLIADDDASAREQMRSLLGQEEDIIVVGEARDGAEAV